MKGALPSSEQGCNPRGIYAAAYSNTCVDSSFLSVSFHGRSKGASDTKSLTLKAVKGPPYFANHTQTHTIAQQCNISWWAISFNSIICPNQISCPGFIEVRHSLMFIHNDLIPSLREKQTNETVETKKTTTKYYSAFNCNKQMVAKLKEITYTLSSLYGFALIEAIITPTFLLYNEVN